MLIFKRFQLNYEKVDYRIPSVHMCVSHQRLNNWTDVIHIVTRSSDYRRVLDWRVAFLDNHTIRDYTSQIIVVGHVNW
jgi:hypothetical protein